jgi:thiol-disulfide isomerase/thioredoxin
VLAPLALAVLLQTPAPELQPGAWRAELASPGGALGFGLWFDVDVQAHVQVAPAGERSFTSLRAEVVNGRERRELASARLEGNEVLLRFDPYDAQIRATLDASGRRMQGTWTKRSAGRSVSLPFQAEAVPPDLPVPADEPPAEARSDAPSPFAGRWAVDFSASDDPAVGEFRCGPGNDPWIEGTFLTTLGDYRYLDGRWSAEGFTLACFDGAHAFLFRARLGEDGALAGDFWSGDAWHETWTAVRDPDAGLPDAFGLTRAVDGVELGGLAFPDLGGELRRLDAPAYAGKARIVQLFGTWCPNCNDEAGFLAELDSRYRAQGLSILGLAFEVDDDHAYAAQRVEAYVRRHGIGYPILIAGTSDKQAASQAFPLVDRVRAFPTTLFLDAQGRVRAVHTGWSGPATGPEHVRLKAEIERLVEELLAEDAR